MSAGWTSAGELRTQVERLWWNGRLLTDASLFPLRLKLRRPDSRSLTERFDEVRAWIRELEGEEALRIEWSEFDHRVLGRNRIPRGAAIERRSVALEWIQRAEEAARFEALAARTAARVPELAAWVNRRPLAALENAGDWERILDVVEWFRANPRSGLYPRQLDIVGVDTKFIEVRKALLAELLDLVVAPAATNPGPRWFERRYGLAVKPNQVRLRILDSALAIGGITDVTLIVPEMARLALPAKRIYITENEVNGLAFPAIPESIVIFGLGYAAEVLAGVPWLADRDVYYWGDIDTYGFHMLDRLRASFPGVRSLLMDQATLAEHRDLCVVEENPYRGPLAHLTESERAVCEGLHGLRLEQERIRYGWVMNALRRATAETRP